jgi:hypothetical protein
VPVSFKTREEKVLDNPGQTLDTRGLNGRLPPVVAKVVSLRNRRGASLTRETGWG